MILLQTKGHGLLGLTGMPVLSPDQKATQAQDKHKKPTHRLKKKVSNCERLFRLRNTQSIFTLTYRFWNVYDMYIWSSDT